MYKLIKIKILMKYYYCFDGFHVQNSEWFMFFHTDLWGKKAESFTIHNDPDQLIVPTNSGTPLNYTSPPTSPHKYYKPFYSVIKLNSNALSPTAPCISWYFNGANWRILNHFSVNCPWSDCIDFSQYGNHRMNEQVYSFFV